MRITVTLTLLIFLTFLFSLSCTKPNDVPQEKKDTVAKVDSLPLTVKNQWQCIIDGKAYSGSVDTSFTQNFFSSSAIDTVIAAMGTSSDGKAHIHFKVAMNRKNFPVSGVNQVSNTFLVFDTSTYNRFTSYLVRNAVINYRIDTLINNNLVVSFNGTLEDKSPQIHTITGKFYCALNTGTNVPNKFYCLLDSVKRAGYFTNATFSANTLVLNGLEYLDFPNKNFRLIVRTGGTIQPGTYKSSNGDACLRVYEAGYGGYFYADDTVGALTIVIQSVSGNEVRGTFAGTNKTMNKVEGGTFVCKVSNYLPQTEAVNKWRFSAGTDPVFGDYECFAGNILSAVRTTTGGRNYVTIKGESDNGVSSFKIVISSTLPIVRGPYILSASPDNVLDTLYFKSNVKTWDGTLPRLWADFSNSYTGNATTVYISYIDNNRISGTFYNYIVNNLTDISFGTSASREIHKASFNAVF